MTPETTPPAAAPRQDPPRPREDSCIATLPVSGQLLRSGAAAGPELHRQLEDLLGDPDFDVVLVAVPRGLGVKSALIAAREIAAGLVARP